MAVKRKQTSTPGQVEGRQSSAGRTRKRVAVHIQTVQRVAIHVGKRTQEGGINNTEAVVFIQERLLIGGARFHILCVERVGRLKPGTCESQVQVDGVRLRELEVQAIENILFVALGMHDGKLRGIEKAAAI